MRVVAFVAAMVLALVTVGGAKGCVKDSGDAAPAPHTSASGFSVPRGAAAPPPMHGSGQDPLDDDFFNPAKPPKGSPKGTVTYEVRVQMYNAQTQPIGGLATAFIDATTVDPRAMSGVGGAHAGPFPYDRESVRMPFQFPIFIQPGIIVSVGATFHAFADKGEIFSCWLVAPGTGEIPGTRVNVHSPADRQLLTVSCFGNIGT